MLCGITRRFHRLSRSYGQVTHALLARPPLSILNFIPKNSVQNFSFDLHVLGTPPAFVLSQDQTLVQFVIYSILSFNSIAYILCSSSLTCFVCLMFFFRIFVCKKLIVIVSQQLSLKNYCKNSHSVHFSMCIYLSASFADSYISLPHHSPFVNTFYEKNFLLCIQYAFYTSFTLSYWAFSTKDFNCTKKEEAFRLPLVFYIPTNLEIAFRNPAVAEPG